MGRETAGDGVDFLVGLAFDDVSIAGGLIPRIFPPA